MAHTLDPYLSIIYNGLTSPQDFRRQFELHCAVNKWDEQAQLKYLPLMLVDKGKRAWDRMTQKTNIKSVLDEIETECAMSKEVALQQFYHAKRDTNESLSKFASRLQSLLNVAQPGNIDSQLPMLKVKLSDSLPESVRLVFTMNSSMTWDEIINALGRLDPVVSLGSMQLENQVRTSGIIKQEPIDTNYVQSQASRNDRFQGRCNFCNKIGHKWMNCGVRMNSFNDSTMNSSMASNQSYQVNNGSNSFNSRDGGPNHMQMQRNNQNGAGSQGRSYGQRIAHQFGGNQNYNNNSNRFQQNQNRSYSNNINGFSFDTTMGHPLANSTFMSEGDNNSDNGFNGQANYLLTQNNLLKNQLNELQNQLVRMQNSNTNASSHVTNSSHNFVHSSQSDSCDRVDEHDSELAKSFPFHATSMSHTTAPIPAVLSAGGDSLLRLNVELSVDGSDVKTVALVDGGSTHSFINPRIMDRSQLDTFENNKHRYEKRQFIITSATGIVRESCHLLTCSVKFGDWAGEIKLVMSNLLDKNNMVIGRDFLKRYGVKVDHGNDMLEIEQHKILVNSVVSDENDGPPIKVPSDVANGRCFVKNKRVLEPNTHNLVEVYFESGVTASDTILFEPVGSGSRGCLFAKSLHQANGNVQYADVMNTSDLAVTLDKNLLLGHVFSCDVPTASDITRETNLTDEMINDRLEKVLRLKFGSKLTADEKNKMVALLVKYYSVFQWEHEPPGRTHVVEHRIETGDARPVVQKQYPIPSIAKSALLEQIKEMLQQGVIRESNSPWRSPVLLIKKKDDQGATKYRFCVDLRKVNAVTIKDSYSLPRIDETVDALCGARWFSTGDVDRAFWQVGLFEDHKQKTAFVVDGQLYEFNVMPFGSMNAPATFQRLMDRVLRGLTWHQCLVYVDDVLIFSKTFDKHLENLENVLKRLASANIRLKPDKCKFGEQEVDYLGFRITDRGIQAARRKVEILMNLDPPATTRALESFLLSINYYRHLIPAFGELSVDLFDMVNSRARFCKWTDKLVNNFKALQQALGNAPILAYPNFDMPFVIQGDASAKAIGGACLQGDSPVFEQANIFHPNNFFGRKLSEVERRWPIMDRELLALVYGYKQSYHLVYGRHIIFVTDHEPLVTLNNLKDPMGRTARLLQQLEGSTYEFRYCPGKLNHLADYLSRADYKGDACADNLDCVQTNSLSFDTEIDWFKEQNVCRELLAVRKLVSERNETRTDWLKVSDGSVWFRERVNLYVFNGVLKFGVNRIVVPSHLRSYVLSQSHDSTFAGHRGSETTFYSISFRYFWPFLRRDVEAYCSTCTKCQTYNVGPHVGKAPLVPIVATRPGQILSLDFVGPLKRTRNGNMFYIFGVDKFTKLMEGTATKTFNAQISAIFIHNEWICRHGMVEVVLTDRGTNFEAFLFQHLCSLLGINKVRTTSFHPQANGGAERVIRNIKPHLAKYINLEQDDWDLFLPMAISSYNNSFNSSIGMTPFEAHYCRPSVQIQDVVLGNPLPSSTKPKDVSEYTLGVWQAAESLRARVRSNLEQAHADQKLQYDRALNHGRKYSIGSWVLIRNHAHIVGLSRSFEPKFVGPYLVVGNRDVTYFIKDELGVVQTVHYNRLIPFRRRPTELETDDGLNQIVASKPAGSIQYAGPALGAGMRVSVKRRGLLSGLIDSDTPVAATNMADHNDTTSLSSSNGSRPSNDLSLNWDGRYDGDSIQSPGEVIDQDSSEGSLNINSVPIVESPNSVSVSGAGTSTSTPHRKNEPFDRMNPPRDALGNPVTDKGKPAEQCMGCKRFYEKKVGLVQHYRSCNLFSLWRDEWVRNNMSLEEEASPGSVGAGRDVGDANAVSS
jgi:hypothetical protein